MYFSRIQAHPSQAQQAALQALTQGLYRQHQWLWQWFAAERGAARDYVFRRSFVGNSVVYDVVSARPPLPQIGAWQSVCKPYEPQLRVGEVLAFELRANPTVKTGPLKSERLAARAAGRKPLPAPRHDVVMQAKKQRMAKLGVSRWNEIPLEQRPPLPQLVQDASQKWLARRAQSLGFELLEEAFQADAYTQHSERDDGSWGLSTVDLSGLLRVRDPEQLRGALWHGVGTGKALGCGLLLVRRTGL